MANVKISQLPNSTIPLSGHETVVMNQNGVTVTSFLSSVKSYIGSTETSMKYANLSANNRFTGSINTMNGLSSNNLSAGGLTVSNYATFGGNRTLKLNGDVVAYGDGANTYLYAYPIDINGSIFWLFGSSVTPP
jgi:hypothetical protein